MSLISADGERTMVTHLGAALELSAGEIEPSIFEGYDCLYVEGYLVQNHDLILKAARTAKECRLKVAIDLASFNIVAENLEFLRNLVCEHVDIVFANEDEAKTFTCEAEPLNALQAISQMCELAVVKIGTKGALIKQGEEVVHVGIMAAARRVDTTGAGDFYAAGFLAGLCDGLSLRQCGTIGAITAGKVIEVVGTTFGEGGLGRHPPAGQQGQKRKILVLKTGVERSFNPFVFNISAHIRIPECMRCRLFPRRPAVSANSVPHKPLPSEEPCARNPRLSTFYLREQPPG